ncbi:DNA binding domain-containing protein, excisionase family [Variovorax sp. OK605]|jgi:excisionase family DNA binding protein|uniref:helix-turn-helix transcriptional regulator n=1 Tax=Variovorax sp. OK605 TaxID=1855317 RepID=UPI0008EACBCA|nr:helix-turn-helix domain-containing protein [Variovorax sp. OK605]SFO84812.1 DNA binding domain-containing protein, excisionase family [Variovorax sp. OK605]
MTVISTPASVAASTAERPRLLTIKRACAELDCSRSTALRMIAAGKLRTVTLSARAVRIVAADVDALIA